MAYQTGTSTGPDDLLDKLRTFLSSNGWTINEWSDESSMYESWSGLNGSGKRLHVQKTAGDSTVMYFNFRSVNRGVVFEDHSTDSSIESYGKYKAEITGIALNGSTGYSASNNWDKQPGYMQSSDGSWGVCMTELSLTAIPAYYFFQDGDTVIVCVEYQSGKFQWLAFGLLEKQGTITGGQFLAGSVNCYDPSEQILNPGNYLSMFFAKGYSAFGNGAVYLDADSSAAWRSSGYMGSNSGDTHAQDIQFPGLPANRETPSWNDSNTINSFFITRAPNHYNGLAPMVPLYVLCKRSNGNYSLLGWPKSIRMLNCYYYDPAEEYNLGSDVWKIFPQHSKDDKGNMMGFAVKKVT